MGARKKISAEKRKEALKTMYFAKCALQIAANLRIICELQGIRLLFLCTQTLFFLFFAVFRYFFF